MSSTSHQNRCNRAEDIGLYALGALPAQESAELTVHIAACEHCHEELNALQSVVDSFAAWPGIGHQPAGSTWDDLLNRIEAAPSDIARSSGQADWIEPEWEDVAPGISCKILSRDDQRDRVTMLVRLEPGTEYPPHTHAGTEELHLLDGELWINEKKLFPGDYNRAVAGTADQRVWSETGCTCLLITSPSDVIS